LQNSLFFSLLAGNLAVETGSHWTASATTQFPESLITEPLREQAALARPVRHVIFGIWPLAGGICRIRGPVSGRKNPVPGAVMPSEEVPMARARVLRIAGTIRPAGRAGCS